MDRLPGKIGHVVKKVTFALSKYDNYDNGKDNEEQQQRSQGHPVDLFTGLTEDLLYMALDSVTINWQRHQPS